MQDGENTTEPTATREEAKRRRLRLIRRGAVMAAALVLVWGAYALGAAASRDDPDRPTDIQNTGRENQEQETDTEADPDEPGILQGTPPAGKARAVQDAMDEVLDYTASNGQRLGDVIKPDGTWLTVDLQHADDAVNDLLKEAYAGGRDAIDGLDDAYATWRATAWTAGSAAMSVTNKTVAASTREWLDHINSLGITPIECAYTGRLADNTPEPGTTKESFDEQAEWLEIFYDAHAACVAGIDEDE